jgi:VWFA-related protein
MPPSAGVPGAARGSFPSRPSLARLVLLLLLTLAPPGASPAPQKPPEFAAQAEIVTVDVVVTDRGGEPVLDLRPEDFTVREDGVEQVIAAFEAVHRPAVAGPAPGGPAASLVGEPRSVSNQVPPSKLGGHFVVVFDELHMTPAEAQRGRTAVHELLASSLASGDRLTLVGTAEGTRWTARLPEGAGELRQALDRLQGRIVNETVRDRMTDYEAMRIDQDRDPIVTDAVMRRFLETGEIRQDAASPGNPVDRSQEVGSWRGQVEAAAVHAWARARMRNEQTLGVVRRSLEALALARGRKSLVLVSGGLVNDPRLAAARQVVTEARRANAAIYFLDARGLVAATADLDAETPVRTMFQDLASHRTEGRERSEGSEGLAADTGGFSLKDRNDLADALVRIALEARSYYLLGYAPSNRKPDGRFRAIEVRVAREGVAVRARRGYYAPGGSEKRPEAAEGRDAAIQRALDAPFDLADVPLRAIADVLGPAEDGKAKIRLTVEADVRGFAFAEKGGTARDTLELLLLVAREDTGEFTRFDQQFEMSLRPQTRARYERDGFPIHREVPLAPGRHQARIVVRDRNGGAVGSLLHAFEVPDLTGLRLSSIALAVGPRGEEPAPGDAPEPTARRQFAPSGVLHCRFEVYGASTDGATGRANVTAGFSVRRSDGKFLAAMPETPLQPAPDGTLARAVGVPLDAVPSGRYETIVVVTDLVAGRAVESREPFEVAAGQ